MKFYDLVKKVKDKDVYMIIGNSNNNQFRYVSQLKAIMKKQLKHIQKDSCLLYFGDSSDPKRPTVGLLFDYIHQIRPDIKIYMIQISIGKSWGIPPFVTDVYWHNDFTSKCSRCKWGGLIKGEPQSNTKKWVSLHNRIPNGIKKVFIFGGGEITYDEYKVIKKLHIPYEYFPVERKYKGDGSTRVKNTDSLKDKIGITYGKIK